MLDDLKFNSLLEPLQELDSNKNYIPDFDNIYPFENKNDIM